MDLGLQILSDVRYGLPCPICNTLRKYKSKAFFIKAKKSNIPCRSCSNSIQRGGKGNLYQGDNKICSKCNTSKPLVDFFKYTAGYHSSCCKECSSSISKEYNKNVFRFSKYGITKIEFEQLLVNQENKCAICKTNINGKHCHIDHCHSSNKVRGLLCDLCNKGLGQFRDSIEFLTSAINYLKK